MADPVAVDASGGVRVITALVPIVVSSAVSGEMPLAVARRAVARVAISSAVPAACYTTVPYYVAVTVKVIAPATEAVTAGWGYPVSRLVAGAVSSS